MTRLVSRVGLGIPTGIDRVERAYLDHVVTRDAPVLGLCRTSSGLALLNRDGLLALRARLDEVAAWGRADLVARLSRSLTPARRQAESDVRRLALAQAFRGRGDDRLARHLPPGTLYLNTGHANLTDATMAMLRRAADTTVAVLVHDTIPLDFPQYQRPGTVESFARKMAVVSRHADRVIAISAATAADARRHLARLGRVPPVTVAHLGVDTPRPVPADLPPGLPPQEPFFVALGTIEPRKNHALLLDAWDRMAQETPQTCPVLVIAGRRGWNNDDVFARLDASPLKGDRVIEMPDLGDGAVAALLEQASGLLFPSHAEGFGLPPVEAALLGTPVISATLPVLREVLGHIPIYADTSNLYSWITTIRRLAEAKRHDTGIGAAKRPTGIPTWQGYFNAVFTKLD